MPYTPAQCRKFAVMAARGEPVPADWKEHCRKRKEKQPKPKGSKHEKRNSKDH